MHEALVNEYMKRGEMHAALAEAQTTLRIYPKFPAAMKSSGFDDADFRVVNLAVELMKVGENDDALEFLNGEIANSPRFSVAWSNRAVIRYQRGEITLAREDAQNALRLDPTNIQAQYLLNSLNATASLAPQR